MLIIEERNYFKKGNKAVIFTPSGEELEIEFNHIYDEDLNEIECARHPREIVKIKSEKIVENSSMIRVKF